MQFDWKHGPRIARWAVACAAALTLGLGAAAQASANTDDTAAVGGQIATELSIGQAVVVATDRLNLRGEPGLNGEVIVVLEERQQATVVDGPVEVDGYAWYQLDAGGTVGWSANSFLAVADTASGDGTSESENDASGDLAIGGDTTALAAGAVAVVNDDNVNLRAEPGLDAEVLLKLNSGTTATVLDGPVDADDYVWYQLDVDGTAGWTAGDFLDIAGTGSDTSFAIGATVTVNDDRVNLRAGTGLDADILDKLATGTTATILDGPVDADGYTWYQLDVDGVTGWVASDYLSAT
jgi:uncharacterized protein YgiM (DUF1202 family)